MLDPNPEHPPGSATMPLSGLTTCGTAGQRSAAEALGEALAKRPPVILLFGEAGVGKSTLLGRFLATIEAEKFAVVQLSATGGEFTGPPGLDTLLESICRQLVAPQPTRDRPATLAVLANAVGELTRAGRTAVIAIDHADHLRDEVISGVANLAKHLDVPPASLVCIFVGSPALASRLDRVLRKPGAPEKVIEIRVSQPSAEELAVLLADEDTAQPGGPMLTAGAIDRIAVYAKSNLHWAVPLADAARTLAAAQGEREVTPELVRGALLELWPPDQEPQDTQPPFTFDPDGSTTTLFGMSDVSGPPAPGAEPEDVPVSSVAGASPTRGPDYWSAPTTPSAEVPRALSAWRRKGLWVALGTLVLLITMGAVAIFVRQASDRIAREPPAASAPNAKPIPVEPGSSEPKLPVTPSTPLQGEGGQSSPPPSTPHPPTPQSSAPAAESGETPGVPGDETPASEAPAQGLAPAPIPAPPPAPSPLSPGEKAATATKPATAKKAVKAQRNNEEGARGKWIQTR